MNSGKKNLESNFLFSLFLLLLTLTSSIIIFLIYSPSKEMSYHSENTPSITGINKQKTSGEKHKKYPLSAKNIVNKKPTIKDNDQKPEVNLVKKKLVEKDMISNAINLVDKGNPYQAITTLEKVLQQNPNNESAIIELAMIYLIDLKEPNTALTYFESSIRINPDNKIVLSELIGLYEELDQVSYGVEQLQDLFDKHPQNAQLALGIGKMMATQNNLDDAIEYLEKSTGLGSVESSLTELADLYSQKGDSERALKTYRRKLNFEIESANKGTYNQKVGLSDEKIALARVDVIGELIIQKKYHEAEKELLKIKEIINEDDILDHFFEEIKNKKSIKNHTSKQVL